MHFKLSRLVKDIDLLKKRSILFTPKTCIHLNLEFHNILLLGFTFICLIFIYLKRVFDSCRLLKAIYKLVFN